MASPNDNKKASGEWSMSVQINGRQIHTKSAQLWRDIKDRCRSGPAQTRFPRYIGCTMSENFKDFQYFANWCQDQIGYNLPNYQIDKDILIPGNKIYGEDYCTFVPRALNSFLCAANSIRGKYPIGVCLSKGKFISTIWINNKPKHLGTYNAPELAYYAYKIAKEAEARRWAQRLEDKEFIIDPRIINALKNWTLKEGINAY